MGLIFERVQKFFAEKYSGKIKEGSGVAAVYFQKLGEKKIRLHGAIR